MTVIELFEAQAARTPDAIALVCGRESVSYARLNERGNRLARYLTGQGLGPEDIVALALPRRPVMVEALLGVLKAGAAYLPVDLDYPPERIGFMLADARPARLITLAAGASRLTDAGVPLEVLDNPVTVRSIARQHAGNPSGGDLNGPLSPLSPAYVIYTSGSTGRPKGVVVLHAGVANLAAHHNRGPGAPGTGPQAGGGRLRVAHTASWSFDTAISPVAWMASGHQMHLIAEDTKSDAELLVACLRRERIDFIHVVPTFARELIEHGLLAAGHHVPGLIVVGGEAITRRVWSDLAAAGGVAGYNAYGPTEATVDTTFARIRPRAAESIGTPVTNMELYVLDNELFPVRPGAAGQLYIAGPGLARGYLKRPGLTAGRFVPCPFGAPGDRMYATGDLVRRAADGELEFIGRLDDQVKLGGLRVELAEVEAVLAAHRRVRQAAVALRVTGPAGAALIGYVVPAARQVIDPRELSAHAGVTLPRYMVPSAIVVMDKLPLTPSGKVDRAALPAPGLGPSGPVRPPRSPREELLCEAFAEVLGVERVGIDNSFFDMGGRSLLAGRLASRIRSLLGAELGIREIFDHPTVAELARVLDRGTGARAGVRPARRPQRVPVSFEQRGMWLLHQLAGPGPVCNMPVAWRLRGELDSAALEGALEDVAGRHEALRTLFADDAGGEVVQRVLDGPAARPELVRARASAAGLAGALARAAGHEFDLSGELPVRAWLFGLGPGEHVLLVLAHHLVSDGWSVGPLARDLSAAYAARRGGNAPGWGPLPVQYADYVLWQRELLGSEDDPRSLMSAHLRYWRQALRGLPPELKLPADRVRPAVPSYQGGLVPWRLDAGTHLALLAVARDCRATLFMVMQAGIAALLTLLGAGTDIAFGSIVAGRGDSGSVDEGLAELVGFFVNPVVLRTDTSGDPGFRELVARVRDADLAAWAHQDMPFERLVKILRPPRSMALHPFFQVTLDFQPFQRAVPVFAGVRAEPVAVDTAIAKFDLTFVVRERHDAAGHPAGIEGALEYSADLFDRATVVKLTRHLARLLETAAASPDLAPVFSAEGAGQ